jgi:hypothetical protein
MTKVNVTVIVIISVSYVILGALCQMCSNIDRTFEKGHILDQIVLLAVAYDGTTNQNLLSSQVVTSETEFNWVWFRNQLGQDFPGSYVLIVDNTKEIESQQFLGSIRNSGCLLTGFLKHIYENAKKTVSSIKGKGDIAACIYQVGKAWTKQWYKFIL